MKTTLRPNLRVLAALALAVTVASCSGDAPGSLIAPEAFLAKGGPNSGAPAVTAADPSTGEQGVQHLQVRVLGSGFNATSRAIWEQDGVEDPKITVHSTTFVSSSEVVADISIALDADTVLYDVAVEITLETGGRKKGVGIEMFEVSHAGGNQAPDVPYYATVWGGLVTNPFAIDPSVGQEQLIYAWAVQTGFVTLNSRYNRPTAGRVHAAFVNTLATRASCKKGSRRITDQNVEDLLNELVSANDTPHGLKVEVDSAGFEGEGSGAVGMHYLTSPASPFYPSEIWVGIMFTQKTSPEYGSPRVTVVSRNGTETVYRYHAGDASTNNGSVRVWWRDGPGGNSLIACKLMDDVYVRVRPGF